MIIINSTNIKKTITFHLHWTWAVVIVWQLNLQLPVQSLPITTYVVSLNPMHGEEYLIKHYVIKVFQWLATDLWFSLGTPISATKVVTEIWTNDGSKVCVCIVVHNIKPLWVIMWHIFTRTNNTTTILFPMQLWELLCT